MAMNDSRLSDLVEVCVYTVVALRITLTDNLRLEFGASQLLLVRAEV